MAEVESDHIALHSMENIKNCFHCTEYTHENVQLSFTTRALNPHAMIVDAVGDFGVVYLCGAACAPREALARSKMRLTNTHIRREYNLSN